MGFHRRLIVVILFLFYCSTGSAQLCQGSLGDPIINITFGAGSNPGASLTAATTSYNYYAGDCPADGSYTVRNNTTNCFGFSWHSLSADHTGDANGYFMLVNASIQPNAFYIDTVKGLCTNTTFEFASWVMNVIRSSACSGNTIPPNLTFTIEKTDGMVLQTYNSGNIFAGQTPTWKQYGFFFTTPAGVSDIVLRIFNNSSGGCGNDLALDDITFRPCGPLITPSIVGSPLTTVSICEGTARAFTFSTIISSGFSNPSFQWQESLDGVNWSDIPGAITNTFTKNFIATTAAGNYKYRLSAAESGNMSSVKCRVVSGVLTINVAANPVTTTSSNTPVCQEGTLNLTATGGTDFQWSGPGNFSSTTNPAAINNAQAANAGKYYVVVKNVAGCPHLDSVSVVINAKPVATTTFATTTICSGKSVQLSSGGGSGYKWIPATSLSSDIIFDPLASPRNTTQYMVIVSNQVGCADSAYVDVTVIEKPTANAGPDKFCIAGSPAQLNGTASGQDVTYSWSPPLYIDDIFSLTPTVSVPVGMDYLLTVVSNAGCGSDTNSTHIYFYKDLFIPTAFTPNNDGKNDAWNIPAINVFSDFEITVFNRYGQIVFHAKNNYQPWDGKYKGLPQPAGVYIYMINLKKDNKLLKGALTIIK